MSQSKNPLFPVQVFKQVSVQCNLINIIMTLSSLQELNVVENPCLFIHLFDLSTVNFAGYINQVIQSTDKAFQPKEIIAGVLFTQHINKFHYNTPHSTAGGKAIKIPPPRSAFCCIQPLSLHFNRITYHTSTFLIIPAHISAFYCITTDISAFYCITTDISAFYCITTDISGFC